MHLFYFLSDFDKAQEVGYITDFQEFKTFIQRQQIGIKEVEKELFPGLKFRDNYDPIYTRLKK